MMPGQNAPDRPAILTAGLIVVVFFCAMAPTLPWLEFSSGSENLNVATALEIRRTGHWLIPALQGKPRIAKPPLTAWLTALAITPGTMARISSPDPAIRHDAFDRLAWEVRSLALLMSCLALAGVYLIGQTVAGNAVGLASALVCGACYAFLRFSRSATTDVTLNFFVTFTNVLLTLALLHEPRIRRFAGAGAFLGLAFMSKGPVALAQTVAPALVFCAWRRLTIGKEAKGKGWPKAIFAGVVAFLIVGVPWYALVAIQMRRQGFNPIQLWFSEVTRVGASDLPPNPWYTRLAFFPLMLPWIIFLLGGLWQSLLAAFKPGALSDPPSPGTRSGLIWMLLLVLVPILIIGSSRDQKERFLLPLTTAGACLAGYAAIIHARTRGQWTRADWLGELIHWIILVGAGVAFPIVAGTTLLKTAGGSPWLNHWQSILAAASCGVILIAGIWLYHARSHPWGLVFTSTLVMLVVQAAFAYGYAKSADGISAARPLADAILQRHRAASIYTCIPNRREPEDLSIYANRIVTEVQSPGEVTAANAVLVTLRRHGRANPEIPSSWRLFATVPEDDDLWLAYEPNQGGN